MRLLDFVGLLFGTHAILSLGFPIAPSGQDLVARYAPNDRSELMSRAMSPEERELVYKSLCVILQETTEQLSILENAEYQYLNKKIGYEEVEKIRARTEAANRETVDIIGEEMVTFGEDRSAILAAAQEAYPSAMKMICDALEPEMTEDLDVMEAPVRPRGKPQMSLAKAILTKNMRPLLSTDEGTTPRKIWDLAMSSKIDQRIDEVYPKKKKIPEGVETVDGPVSQVLTPPCPSKNTNDV